MNMEIFARRLKYEREQRKRKNSKWTQGFVADMLGVARTTYTAYENGTKQPPIETINKIADFFNVKVDYLLGRTDEKNSSGEQNNLIKTEETYDSLSEINKIIREFGIEDMGFFDIEKWKNLTPDDVDEIRRHFEWVAQKAKERKEEK